MPKRTPRGAKPKAIRIGPIPILATAALALFLLGHAFAAEWPKPPPGQPDQIWSKVEYDPNLSDPFFESNEWSYPDYDSEGVPDAERPKDPPRLKHTAKCFSSSGGENHLVNFCDAKVNDVNSIDLFIYKFRDDFYDALRVQIRDGFFRCQYSTVFLIKRRVYPHMVWRTRRQKLTLDRKTYEKGAMIKGRLDFECVQTLTNPQSVTRYGLGDPSPVTISVYGVFRTTVE